jgi:arsenate reductase
MAEALLKHHGGEMFRPYSAGYEARGIHPMTLQVLEEVGADVSGLRSKSVAEYNGYMNFDYVTIVCRKMEEKCPTINANTRKINRWLFEDPARFEGTDEAKLAKFRQVRDEISERIQLWLAENAEAEWAF